MASEPYKVTPERLQQMKKIRGEWHIHGYFPIEVREIDWLIAQAELVDRLTKKLHRVSDALSEAQLIATNIEDERNLLREQEVEACRRLDALEEWKRSVLNAVKQIPEYEIGVWGSGDKEGWGYVFEVIRWQTRRVSRLRELLEKTEGWLEETWPRRAEEIRKALGDS